MMFPLPSTTWKPVGGVGDGVPLEVPRTLVGRRGVKGGGGGARVVRERPEPPAADSVAHLRLDPEGPRSDVQGPDLDRAVEGSAARAALAVDLAVRRALEDGMLGGRRVLEAGEVVRDDDVLRRIRTGVGDREVDA